MRRIPKILGRILAACIILELILIGLFWMVPPDSATYSETKKAMNECVEMGFKSGTERLYECIEMLIMIERLEKRGKELKELTKPKGIDV